MADRAPLSYLPEIDEESMRANFAYKEALQRLTDALDQRKNRFIDPRWGAAIKAFSTPTRTGSGIEAIGNVAGAVGQAQEEMFKEEQDIAKAQLDVASQGLGLERQRQMDRMYAEAMGGKPSAPATPAGALPAGPSGGAMEPASSRVQGAPAEQFGIRIAPPPTGQISREQFLSGERLKGTPLSEALAKWEEIERKREEINQAGIFRGGMFYPTAKGDLVDVENIPLPSGGYGTFKTDSVTATMLAHARRNGDIEKELWLIKRILARLNMDAGAPQGTAQVMPGATGVESNEDKARREAMEKSERERAQKLQEERDKKAVERETELSTRDEASRRIFGATERVSGALKQSPNFFGIFEKPTVVAAIGRAVSEGIQTPAGTLNMAGFENAMRQAMPNVSQQDLDNVSRSAADLAEIELAYTQLYMQKQGAITEGERAIVRRLGGSTSNSPGVLKGRMMLLKERSQYDIDRIDAYKKWQAQNPTKTINDFDRSQEAANLKSRFETRLSKIFGTEAALPSSKKGKRSPSERLNDILGGQ